MLDKLFISVLNMSLVGSYAIIFVLISRLLLKKAPKLFPYVLWGVVLFRLLCPFSFESVLSLMPVGEAPIPQDIAFSTAPQIGTGIASIDGLINPLLPVPNNTANSINPIQVWIFIGSRIWVIGVFAMLIYGLVSFAKLKKRLIGAIHLAGIVYLADHISSPFVMGLFKPKIYLPSYLSDIETDFIITHEMCHIRRFDHVSRILGFAALSLHWFNPFVWSAFVVSGKDMEMSCDEAVIKKTGADIRAEYSQSLLRFGSAKGMLHATPLAFGEGNTKSRICNVLKYRKPILFVSIIAIIAVSCIAIGLVSNRKIVSAPEETHSVSVENLWKSRSEYVGNSVAIGNILSELSFSNNLQYVNFELKTKEHPYEIIMYLNEPTDSLKTTDTEQMKQNARIVFALIGNVEQITFSANGKDSKEPIIHFVRSDYVELFDQTARFEDFQSVLTGILDDSHIKNLVAFETIKIGTEQEEIHKQFGKPIGTLSGVYGDIYIVRDMQVIIYYKFISANSHPVTAVNISAYVSQKLTQ